MFGATYSTVERNIPEELSSVMRARERDIFLFRDPLLSQAFR